MRAVVRRLTGVDDVAMLVRLETASFAIDSAISVAPEGHELLAGLELTSKTLHDMMRRLEELIGLPYGTDALK
jgi:hypothetical protein